MLKILELTKQEEKIKQIESKGLNNEEIEELISLLYENNNEAGLESLLRLYYRSYYYNDIYEYWDLFVSMLDSEKQIERTRAIFLLSINTKWDEEKRFEKIADKFLEKIEDEKAIISRQCIKSLENIIPHKKNLHSIIKNKLKKINYSKYMGNIRDIIHVDVTQILNLLA